MIYDLHVHSNYSHDSLLSPEKIIIYAKKRELDGIAITDHNTIRGGLVTSRINKDKDFEIIVGSEFKTEYDDVIGLFLNEEINTKVFAEVVDEIHAQGGLSILAHPYRRYKFPERLIGQVDLIEGFNARSAIETNKRACNLAKSFNKPMTAGSDAHCWFEIGKGTTVVKSNLFKELKMGGAKIKGSESFYAVHVFSVLIERVKRISRCKGNRTIKNSFEKRL